MSEKARRLIEKEKNERTGKLNLGNCNLTDLEEEIPELFDLDWLEDLRFSDSNNPTTENILGEISPQFRKFKNLKILHYNGSYHNEWNITSINPLFELEKIEVLVVAHSTLSDFNGIQKLKNLRVLNLSKNRITDIDILSSCKNLWVLTLAGNKIPDLMPITKISNLYILDVLGVKTDSFLPIGKNKNLHELSISNIKKQDFGIFQKLKRLKKLKIYDKSDSEGNIKINYKEKLDKEIESEDISCFQNLEYLENLEKLYISHENLWNLDFLEGMKNLRKLFIRKNSIKEIESIKYLEKLEVLNLSLNNVENISVLGNLKSLNSLSLNPSSIFEILKISSLKWVQKLPKLERLYLHNCTFKNPKYLGKIPQLLSLTLSTWSESNIDNISFMRYLTNLETLNLSGSKVSDISYLQSHINLRFLNLSSTSIQSVEALRNLINLEMLILDDTKITDIEPINHLIEKGLRIEVDNSYEDISEFLEDDSMHIFIDNCAIENPPFEIVKQGNQAVLDYFKEKKKGVVQNKEVKLILIGNSTTGKSSLSQFLRERSYSKDQESTHGGDFVKIWTPADRDIRTYIWDFGGQEYYHATHRLFLSDNSVYVLVWDEKTNRGGFLDMDIVYKDAVTVKEKMEHFPYTYWLSNIRHYAPNSKTLLVCNKCDLYQNNIPRISDAAIKDYQLGPEKFEFQLSIEGAHSWVENGNSSLKKWSRSFEDFEENLLERLENAMRSYELIRYWIDIRDEIIRLSKDRKVINWSEFEELCRKFDDSPNFDLVIIYLRDICGVALYYPQNDKLKNRIFIDPNWVNDRIYSVLDYSVKVRGGRFDFNHVCKVLNDTDEKAKEVLSLMEEFELIFEVKEQENQFIAPQYLPFEYPDQERLEEILRFTTVYHALTIRMESYLPRSVIARFIARNGLTATEQFYWKFGILFKKELSAYVKCIHEKNQIEILVQQAEEPSSRLNVVKSIFNELKAILESEDFQISSDGNVFVKWTQVLKTAREEGTKVETDDGESYIPIKKFEHLIPFKLPKEKPIDQNFGKLEEIIRKLDTIISLVESLPEKLKTELEIVKNNLENANIEHAKLELLVLQMEKYVLTEIKKLSKTDKWRNAWDEKQPELENMKVDAKGKIELIIPFIPGILNYKTELTTDFKGSARKALSKLWKSLVDGSAFIEKK